MSETLKDKNSLDDSKVVSAVLLRMDALTRDQWLERLSWTPEGLEHKQVLPREERCVVRTLPSESGSQMEANLRSGLKSSAAPNTIADYTLRGLGAREIPRKRSRIR